MKTVPIECVLFEADFPEGTAVKAHNFRFIGPEALPPVSIPYDATALKIGFDLQVTQPGIYEVRGTTVDANGSPLQPESVGQFIVPPDVPVTIKLKILGGVIDAEIV